MPRSLAVLAGLGVVIGLAVAAPGHSASPSTAASRIVGWHHKKPEPAKHRTDRPERRDRR